MKKCKAFVSVCTALLVVLLASCSNEDKNLDPSSKDGAVRIKITRSEAPGTKVPLSGIDYTNPVDAGTALSIGSNKGGHLLFVDASGSITKYVEILASGASGADGSNRVGFDEINGTNQLPDEGGALISDVPSESAKVYIFLNLPTTVTGLDATLIGTEISELAQSVTAIDISDASGGVLNVPVSGSGNLVPATGQTYDRQAIFDLKAIASRIELTRVTGGVADDGLTKIGNFDITGIYINNYYPEVTLGDKYEPIVNAGQVGAHYDHLDGTFYWTGANKGTSLYTIETTGNGLGNRGTYYVTAPYEDLIQKVWAYNVFPNDVTGVNSKSLLPHIILRLRNIQILNATTNEVVATHSEKYITVKGYISTDQIGEQPAGSLQYLERGYIYSLGTGIGGNDFTITPDDLDDNPEEYDIEVFVRATLIPWQKVPVSPEY